VDPVKEGRKLRNLVGVQLQSAGLPESITPDEAMRFFSAYHNVKPRFDLLERPEWAHFLLDQLADLARRNAETLARAGVDVLALDDDVGMPGTMMISPDTWRTFFRPRLAAIIQAARASSPTCASCITATATLSTGSTPTTASSLGPRQGSLGPAYTWPASPDESIRSSNLSPLSFSSPPFTLPRSYRGEGDTGGEVDR
jgi:hypothetical protein